MKYARFEDIVLYDTCGAGDTLCHLQNKKCHVSQTDFVRKEAAYGAA